MVSGGLQDERPPGDARCRAGFEVGIARPGSWHRRRRASLRVGEVANHGEIGNLHSCQIARALSWPRRRSGFLLPTARRRSRTRRRCTSPICRRDGEQVGEPAEQSRVTSAGCHCNLAGGDRQLVLEAIDFFRANSIISPRRSWSMSVLAAASSSIGMLSGAQQAAAGGGGAGCAGTEFFQ